MSNNKSINDQNRFGFEDDPFRLDPRFSSGLAGYEASLQGLDLNEGAKSIEQEVDELWQRGVNLDDVTMAKLKAAGDLKTFLRNLTPQDLEELSQRSGNPDLKRKVEKVLRDQREDTAIEEFERREPGYHATDRNGQLIEDYLSEHGLAITANNLQAAFHALRHQGVLDVREDEIKALTEKERLTVARFAQNGQLEHATNLYVHYALPSWSEERIAMHTSDPAFRQLLDNCAMFVFVYATDDFPNTPENRDALVQAVGDKPLTISLLRTTWDRLKGAPAPEPEPEPEPEVDLDALTTDQVEAVLAKARADKARRRR